MEKESLLIDRSTYGKMSKEERLQSFKRTIAHPHLEAADKALREAIRETGGASLVNVYGPARVGKTTMKNHVIRTIILEMLPLLEQDRERIPILSLTPRPPLSGSFSWKDFFQSGLLAFDEPLIAQKIAFDLAENEEQADFPKRDASQARRKPEVGTKDALRLSFETATRHRRTIAILIDEAQHLGKVNGLEQLKNQLDCIKSLADETSAIIVLIGTYELLPLRNLSAQLIGRSLDIHFPRYRNTKKELSQFRNVLLTFQNALPFVEETDLLLKQWEFCYEQSIGCVGNLRLMLVRAVHDALWADAKTLNWDHLKGHAFSDAKKYEMMLEAYEGERDLASKPHQREQFLKMLGLSSQNQSQDVPQPDTPQAFETTSQTIEAQNDQPEGSTRQANQQSSLSKISSPETSSAFKPVSHEQQGLSSGEAKEDLSTEQAPPKQVRSSLLKKPLPETARPFRRKARRDKTGGSQQKNEEKD
jgi:AAA domain